MFELYIVTVLFLLFLLVAYLVAKTPICHPSLVLLYPSTFKYVEKRNITMRKVSSVSMGKKFIV